MRKSVKYFLTCSALLALALSGCSGGGDDDDGGGGGGTNQVTISGVVDDGTATSPIPGANCQLLDQANVSRTSADADANGVYELQAPTEFVGYIACTHPNFPNLILTAFISTVGQAAGAALVQDLTPESSMVHRIITRTNPSDPQATKEQLLSEIAAGNPAASLLAEAATIIFNAMLDASLDVNFQSVLDDLMADGQVSLQELQPIMPEIEQAIAAAEQRLGITLADAIIEKLGQLDQDQNVPPVAQDDAIATDENVTVIGTLLASDLDGDPLTFRITENGALGVVAITDPMTGAFTYTPNENVNGEDAFRFVANDGVSDSAPATVTVTINPVNDPPVAQDDAATTDEDNAVAISVLQNDIDPDGGVLSIDASTFPVTAPSNGAVVIDGASILYTPNANFSGMDAFSYRVCNDGAPALCSADAATVTVTVNPINDPPVAQDDGPIATNVNTPVAIPVLANDVEVDGDALTIEAVTQGSMGTVAPDGASVVYTPNPGFQGPDMFTYTISDGQLTDTATVTVTVTTDQSPPVAQNDVATTLEDTAVTINVLQNDTDPDGDTLSIDASNFPVTTANGMAVIEGANIRYTPNANFSGEDMFSYRVCDNSALALCSTNPATVTVSVTSVAETPVAQDDAASTDEDMAVTINVLENDTDPDGDPLTIDSATFPVTAPTNGVAVIDGANVVYTPNADYSGPDTFSYSVCDNGSPALCSTGTVAITVNPVNDAPVALDDMASTAADTAVTIDVLLNDTDPDGDPLTIDSATFPVTPPSNGVAAIDGANVVYTPNAGYSGPDAFSYSVCDNGAPALCSAATVNITVNAPNTLPVITQAPPTQMSIVGRDITPLDLRASMVITDVEDGDCSACAITVVNLPPYLSVANDVVSGAIASNAFGLNLGNPTYAVEVQVEDSNGGVASAIFNWRVAQEQVEVIPDGSGGGDGDSDGDGGVEGIASDGAGLPLAGAMCRLLDLDGMPVQNQGVAVSDDADANGVFLLSIPQVDPANMTPGAPLQDVEGFIECNPAGRPDLAVSSYVNAKGMQRNERLRNMVVDPTTTIMRKIAESFRAAGASRDMVNIQTRHLNDINSLQTGNPMAVTSMAPNEAACAVPDPMTEVTTAITTPLLAPPVNNNENLNAGMVAYAASQLYLVALKGEAVGTSTPIVDDPMVNCLDDNVPEIVNPQLMDYSTVLNNYFTTGGVTVQDLAELGLTQNAGLVTGPRTNACGCEPSYTGRPEILVQSMLTDKVDAETTLAVALTDAVTRGRFHVRVMDNQNPPQVIAGARVRARNLGTGSIVADVVTDANGDAVFGVSLASVNLFAVLEYRIIVDNAAGFVDQTTDVAMVGGAALDVVMQLQPVAGP